MDKLLIVDDELSVREVLADGLATFGYDTRMAGSAAGFAMLAPHRLETAVRYELYVRLDTHLADDLDARLDQALCDNPHYRLCRELGQLDAAVVVPVGPDAQSRFLDRLRAQGRRLGDIKPAALTDQDGWRATFGVD